MIIDQEFLDARTAEAKANPRLRQAFDMRTDGEDKSQRMFNAMEPGTVLPIHRHRETDETIVCVRGRVRQIFYDEKGCETESFIMEPNGENVAVQIPKGVWHRLVSLESGSVIFEAKDGPYKPIEDIDILNV